MKKQISTILGLCLLLSTAAKADQQRELVSNEAAMAARYHLIKGAKSEILAQYYEVGRDSTAFKGLALLQEAARRGVHVKLIVDNMHSQLSRADLAALTGVRQNPALAHNFEVKVFNPISNLNLLSQTYRDHSKRMIVDGEALVIGGRNAAEGYFGNSSTKTTNFRDLELMVRGQSAQVARQDFLDLWNKNKMLKDPDLFESSQDKVGIGAPCHYETEMLVCGDSRMNPVVKEIEKSQKQLDDVLMSLQDKMRSVQLKSMDDLFKNSEDVDVQFVSNDPGKVMKKVDNTLADQLFRYLDANVKQSITIVTPYLFPTEQALQHLERWSQERKIKIRIVTNSLASSDMPIVHAGYLSIRDRLAKMGVEVYEYRGPEILHAKVLVMDAGTPNATTMTGSFNFDRRSAVINREIGVIITGKDRQIVATRVNGALERIINDSIASIQDGRIVNQDKLQELLYNLGEKVATQKLQDVENNRSLVKLMPDQI